MQYNPTLEPREGNRWQSTDDDPWFLIDGPFEPGEYWLEFHARLISNVPASNMKLYVGNENRSFSEANVVVLGRMPQGSESPRIKMRVRIHQTVSVFRLDPLQAAAEFELGPVTLTLRKAWLTDFRPEGSRAARVAAATRPGVKTRARRTVQSVLRSLTHMVLDWKRVNEIDVGSVVVEKDHGHDELPPAKVEVKSGHSPILRQFDLPWIHPLNVEVRSDLPQKLNVMLPGITMRNMTGGPNTVINLTYRLAREGVPIRYVSTDIPEEPDHSLLFQHFQKLTGLRRLPNVEIVSGADKSRPLPLGDKDVFFGTSWWTVQLINGILPRMRSPRFVYMIQDFEPGFLPWSSANSSAEETYGFDYRAVICGQLLADYLCVNRVGRFEDPNFIQRCAAFEPAVDRTRFRFDRQAHAPDRKKLLFYSRPSAPRNLYEMGLYALREAVASGCFRGEEWELWGMGEPIPICELVPGTALRPWPWSNYDDYAKLLRSADVGLSLMQSPHTSYPPLEMAACGAQVVTNCFSVKSPERLTAYSKNIVPVKATVADIVRGLREAEQRIVNWGAREQASRLQLPSTWDDVFEPLLPSVLGMWEECRALANESFRVTPRMQESKRAA